MLLLLLLLLLVVVVAAAACLLAAAAAAAAVAAFAAACRFLLLRLLLQLSFFVPCSATAPFVYAQQPQHLHKHLLVHVAQAEMLGLAFTELPAYRHSRNLYERKIEDLP